ncbi:hypothetical protein GCM10027168_14690 [Streptomyces capparidis]
MPTGSGLRLVRSAVFAAVCVAVTGLGHALMSDDAVPRWVVGGAFAAVASASWWLTGRERGPVAVTAATVLTQLTLHAAFAASAPPAGPAPASAAAVAEPGAHHAAHTAALSGHLHTATEPGSSAGMMLAHVLAGLLCGLWLARGEAAVFLLGRALAACLLARLELAGRFLTGLAVHRPPRPPRPPVRVPRRLRDLLLRHLLTRRGPPVPSARA